MVLVRAGTLPFPGLIFARTLIIAPTAVDFAAVVDGASSKTQ